MLKTGFHFLYLFFKFLVVEDEGEILSSESAKTDEIIYENYGPDKGNRWMTTSELEQYITEKGNKGLSEEYLKIKNEPVTGSADYFRLEKGEEGEEEE